MHFCVILNPRNHALDLAPCRASYEFGGCKAPTVALCSYPSGMDFAFIHHGGKLWYHGGAPAWTLQFINRQLNKARKANTWKNGLSRWHTWKNFTIIRAPADDYKNDASQQRCLDCYCTRAPTSGACCVVPFASVCCTTPAGYSRAPPSFLPKKRMRASVSFTRTPMSL